MNTKPPDAQELRFRLAMLQMEAMEFRRLLRHATMNVVVMEEMAEQATLVSRSLRGRFLGFGEGRGRISDAGSS
jgi:hypothetical protein